MGARIDAVHRGIAEFIIKAGHAPDVVLCASDVMRDMRQEAVDEMRFQPPMSVVYVGGVEVRESLLVPPQTFYCMDKPEPFLDGRSEKERVSKIPGTLAYGRDPDDPTWNVSSTTYPNWHADE